MWLWPLTLAILLGRAVVADAAPVSEFELDGTASNNSPATAQLIPTSAFTLPVPETVFDPPGFRTATLTGIAGGPDVDVFRISGHGRLLLDVDQAINGSSLDTVLFLWNSSGVALRTNDDASINEFPDGVPNADLGSNHTHDSRIFITLPKPDVYFVGITRYFNTVDDCLGGTGPSCDFPNGFFENGPQPIEDITRGDYLLHLSLEHPHRVPMPATLALLVSAGGLALSAHLWIRRTQSAN
jgi:hypothetical protein